MDPTSPAADVLVSEVHGNIPMPVTPGDDTERPDGVAFDLPAGTATPGMPTGNQRATNEHTAQASVAHAQVPPGGMNPTGAQDPPV